MDSLTLPSPENYVDSSWISDAASSRPRFDALDAVEIYDSRNNRYIEIYLFEGLLG